MLSASVHMHVIKHYPLEWSSAGKAAAALPGLPRKKARRLDFGTPGGPMPVHGRFAAAATDTSGNGEVAAAAAGASADGSDARQEQQGSERQQAPLSARRGSSAALAAALRDYTGDGSEIPDSVRQAVAAGELPVSLRAVQVCCCAVCTELQLALNWKCWYVCIASGGNGVQGIQMSD